MKRMIPFRPWHACALALAGAAAAPGAARAAETLPVCPVKHGQTVTYDVIRGGSVIGSQKLHFTGTGDELAVDVEIGASIEMLSISVYKYHHRGREEWRHGELVSLEAETDDDGTPRHVSVHRDPKTGTWLGIAGPPPPAGPLVPASLWNAKMVSQTHLLDRETGEVVKLTVSHAADEMLHLGGRDIPAERFDMSGQVKGSVWYDRAGCWLRALFNTRVDGSQIEVVLK